ncbi:hypothetical protein [Solibacillus sp. FSL K6-1554]|uniref:hypothetical protein n=1 Tax=Solibacillus sp. FSL K6-1554 TaxID=2921472 RepID=UPI0030F8B7F2
MELILDTKQIYYDRTITINGQLINKGMDASTLEKILQQKITDTRAYCWHVCNGMFEDEQPNGLQVIYKDDLVEKLALYIDGLKTEDEAMEYLDKWIRNRGFSDKAYGDGIYKTDFGYITVAVSHYFMENKFSITIELTFEELPTRKFGPFTPNAVHSGYLFLKGEQYTLLRLTIPEVEQLPIFNVFGNGPMSLNDSGGNWSFTDRFEIIYFAISKIENGNETILGILETTYFSITDSYTNKELYWDLDNLNEEWGLLGETIERYGCDLDDLEEISPFCLVYEKIHNELPENKDLFTFMNNSTCMHWLFEASGNLTAKYVGIKNKEDLTFIQISEEENVNGLRYSKPLHDFYINYRR